MPVFAEGALYCPQKYEVGAQKSMQGVTMLSVEFHPLFLYLAPVLCNECSRSCPALTRRKSYETRGCFIKPHLWYSINTNFFA